MLVFDGVRLSMVATVALLTLVFLFPVGEIALAVLRRAPPGTSPGGPAGASTRLLWILIGCGVLAGIVGSSFRALRLPGPRPLLAALAGVLLATGLALRWVAVLTLGPFFTVDLAIREDHVLVSRGVYRYLRHPSYAGLLLALAGLGVFFGNWLGLGTLILPPFLALRVRMRAEEAALLRALGPVYAAYCARTRRLIPGVY